MKQKVMRVLIYLFGTALLALGITFMVKADLGVSPIASIPYVLSVVLHIELGNTTFLVFAVLVVLQIFLRGKNFKLYDLLQIPFSLIFSKFVTFFNTFLPFQKMGMPLQIVTSIVGILLMGIGAGTLLAMRLPPNAGDGFVQTFSDVSRKNVGLCKNIFDFTCVAIAVIISLLTIHKPIGIGVGTVFAIIGVGRVLSLYQKFALSGLRAAAGMTAAS